MGQQIRMCLRWVMRDERGATAIEYGLLAALIAVAFFAGAKLLGQTLSALYTDISNYLVSVTPIGGGS